MWVGRQSSQVRSAAGSLRWKRNLVGERGFCWGIFIVAPQIQVFTGFSLISITLFFPCHIEFDFLLPLNFISTLVFFLFLFNEFIKKNMVYLMRYHLSSRHPFSLIL